MSLEATLPRCFALKENGEMGKKLDGGCGKGQVISFIIDGR